jgi:MFS family permease
MLENREDLANAIALNSAMVNGSRLFGPTLAALLITSTGEAGCFFLNGISFLAVLIALRAMRLPPRPITDVRKPVLHGLREGMRYVAGHAPIRALLVLVGVVSFVGLPYSVLLPVYARETMGDRPTAYGLLMTAPGVGALAASLVIAWLGLRHAFLRVALGPVVTGVCLIGFAATKTLWWNLPFLFGAGVGIMFLLNTSNTLLQSLVPDAMRGRVLSFYTMSFLGMAPLGSLVLGAAADAIGVRQVVMIAGSVCLAAGAAFAVWMGRWLPALHSHLASAATTLTPPTFPARTDLEAREDAATGIGPPSA